ncbi:MAG: hypothetical protein M1497_13050 [Nitrospirae bacterium]|nr:hypothetical protein [Nitrospirota bacterium]
MRFTAGICAVILSISVPACAASGHDTVKDFTLRTVDGKTVSTGAFSGMPLVVAVLSPW